MTTMLDKDKAYAMYVRTKQRETASGGEESVLELQWRPLLPGSSQYSTDEETWITMDLPIGDVTAIVRHVFYQSTGWTQMIGNRTGPWELPCPTDWNIDYDELTVKAGPLWQKTGSREDVEAIIARLQEALDEMPEGIDTQEKEYEVSYSIVGTVRVDGSVLLNEHSSYQDNGLFIGSEDEMIDAIEQEMRQGYVPSTLMDAIRDDVAYGDIAIDSWEEA